MGYKKQINVKLNLWDTDVKKIEEIAKEYDVTLDELVTEVLLSYKALKKEYREVLSKKQLLEKLKENADFWEANPDACYYDIEEMENFIVDILGDYFEDIYTSGETMRIIFKE